MLKSSFTSQAFSGSQYAWDVLLTSPPIRAVCIYFVLAYPFLYSAGFNVVREELGIALTLSILVPRSFDQRQESNSCTADQKD